MKQLKGKYSIILITIVIVIGIIMTIVFGFNKELQYQQTNSIDIYLDKEVDLEKAKGKSSFRQKQYSPNCRNIWRHGYYKSKRNYWRTKKWNHK